MPNSRRDSRPGYISQEPSFGSTESFLDISSLKRQQPVTLLVFIVQERGSVTIWTFDSLKKSWTRLVSTELEALAYTFSESPSFTQGSLTLAPTLNGKIRATLYSSPQMVQNSMNASMTLRGQVLIKSYGAGDLKRNLPKKLRRILGNGESSE